MDNEKFQDLMLEHFGKVLNKLDGLESRLGNVETRLVNVESEVSGVKQSQARMENEFGRKLDILYYDWREAQERFNEEN